MEEYRFKYYLIYTIASLICLVVATQIDYKKNKMLSKVSTSLAIAFCLIFIFLFGLRKDTIGTDTPNYLFQFDRFETIDFGNDVVMYYIYLLWNFAISNIFNGNEYSICRYYKSFYSKEFYKI
jgi:Mn2+/Fe2+ NRAMP family transporter